MSKKKNGVKVKFIGRNATNVAGSITKVEANDFSFLIDFGASQSNNKKTDFLDNMRLPKDVSKKIEFVFITHSHVDHCGRLPLLIANNIYPRIIVPKGNKKIIEAMLYNSCGIIERDAFSLGRAPYFTKQHVRETIKLIEEFDFNKKYNIREDFAFELFHAGHIFGSSQIKFYIKEGLHEKTIVASGDLGNKYNHNPFVEPMQQIKSCDIFIGECTYGEKNRSKSKDLRYKDREKMDVAIRETMQLGSNVLIPSFSLSRTAVILNELYQIYKDDKTFNYPVVIDSPLSIQLLKLYFTELENDGQDLMKELLSWDALYLSEEHKTHKLLLENKRPKIIISSSGFLQHGRSFSWVTNNILEDKGAEIILIGYTGEGTIAYKISNNQKTITINGKKYKNKCGLTILNSFSSHCQFDELIDYYSNINCKSIYLVHGSEVSKNELAQELQKEIENKNKTTRVVKTNKGTVANL